MGIQSEVLALAFDLEVASVAVRRQNEEMKKEGDSDPERANARAWMDTLLLSLPEDSALRVDVESLRG